MCKERWILFRLCKDGFLTFEKRVVRRLMNNSTKRYTFLYRPPPLTLPALRKLFSKADGFVLLAVMSRQEEALVACDGAYMFLAMLERA
jgi:hypothetical protein